MFLPLFILVTTISAQMSPFGPVGYGGYPQERPYYPVMYGMMPQPYPPPRMNDQLVMYGSQIPLNSNILSQGMNQFDMIDKQNAGKLPTAPMFNNPLGTQSPSEFNSPYGNVQQGNLYQGDEGMSSVPRDENRMIAGATRIIPDFLKNASKGEVDKFYEIVQNPTWSAREKQEKIDEFMRGLAIDAQNLYAEFQQSSKGSTADKQQKVHEAVNSMSGEAQVQFQKVSALMTNLSINDNERLQKIQDIYNSIPESIKKEFDSKFGDL